MGGSTQVRCFDQGGIGLAACPSNRDDLDPVSSAIGDHGSLGAVIVAAIDDKIVVAIDHFWQVLRGDEVFNLMHLAIRVDLQDALMHRCHLGLTELTVEGMDLSIDIGLGHIVQIDKSDLSDATSCQCFCCP